MPENLGTQPAIVEKLATSDPEQQADVLRKLCNLESVHGICLQVIALSRSQDDDVRMWSAEALETSIQPTSADIPGLVQTLKTSDEADVCYWAATMLGRLGTEAASASQALAAFAETSEHLAAREQAVWALCQLGPAASHAILTMQRIAEDAPARLHRMVQHAIERLQGENDQGIDDSAEKAA
ncbi:MAG: HEAT repeat domain-containing protein [Rubripirellula sp.]